MQIGIEQIKCCSIVFKYLRVKDMSYKCATLLVVYICLIFKITNIDNIV